MTSKTLFTAIALAALSLLSACGGGDGPDDNVANRAQANGVGGIGGSGGGVTGVGGIGGSGGGATGVGGFGGSGTLSAAVARACGLSNVNVTIARARLNPDGAADLGSAGWVDVALAAPVRMDLLTLAAGAVLPLDLSGLPSGTYRQMRLLLVAGDAAAPLSDSVVGVGGVETALAVPSVAQGGLPMAVRVSVAGGQVAVSYQGLDVCAAVASSAGQYALDAVTGGATPVATAY
jgi:hypothetical protein